MLKSYIVYKIYHFLFMQYVFALLKSVSTEYGQFTIIFISFWYRGIGRDMQHDACLPKYICNVTS